MLLLDIKLFIENAISSSLTLVKVALLSKCRGRIKRDFENQACIILGNGPSLNRSITDNPEFLKGKKLICVNDFPKTDLYEKIKPEIFVTTAPEFWLENIKQMYKDNGRKIFEAIASKTTWKIRFYIPAQAKNYKAWQEILATNTNVSIHYFNNTPVEGFRWFRNLFFKWNLGMTRPHNVAIPSIMISLNLGFKEIYLFGVDHSWIPEISVDDNNRVLVNQKHFYDEGKTKGLPMGVTTEGKGDKKLHEVLQKFLHTFEGYFTIRDYAESIHAKIFNCTPGSFIDAFERLRLHKKEE
ncbi:MAG: DUF115 domain-containing protein [Bacteroidales bacterium]|nr:DUF115 domain-containing protein [Bacteroidales bacterium]MCF8456469.1 DUF115 domain-containing protein [Bacteroidales bacterium]